MEDFGCTKDKLRHDRVQVADISVDLDTNQWILHFNTFDDLLSFCIGSFPASVDRDAKLCTPSQKAYLSERVL
jgi:hypothetical protein